MTVEHVGAPDNLTENGVLHLLRPVTDVYGGGHLAQCGGHRTSSKYKQDDDHLWLPEEML